DELASEDERLKGAARDVISRSRSRCSSTPPSTSSNTSSPTRPVSCPPMNANCGARRGRRWPMTHQGPKHYKQRADALRAGREWLADRMRQAEQIRDGM